MLSRISYAFRETYASFRRNTTLTVASILTAAVALMLAGATLLIQKAFDNLLVRWEDGVEMIVFVKAGASQEQLDALREAIVQTNVTTPDGITYLDKQQAFDQAKVVLAGQDTLLGVLTVDTVPTQFRIKPTAGLNTDLEEIRAQLLKEVGVQQVGLASEIIKVYRSLGAFIRTFTGVASVVLLSIAVLLIWNTIRTAMFARRREIEVMKLVGATDWFIRIPFMLEGLIQGLIGAVVASVGLIGFNGLWSGRLESFKAIGNDTALTLLSARVDGGFLNLVSLLIIAIGMLAGAIGAGVASSKFLDV